MTEIGRHRANRLLAAIPDRELVRLAPSLQIVSLAPRFVLVEAESPLRYAYFPHSGVICLMAMMGKATAETATVGPEGFIGFEALLGGAVAGQRALVHVGGTASRMPVKRLMAVARQSGRLKGLLLGYVRYFILQVSQSVACNGLHSAHQRGARWKRGADAWIVGVFAAAAARTKARRHEQAGRRMSRLLNRTLGENIEIETVLAARLWAVSADINQLDNAMMNLAINARDAMPNVGKLTIETGNIYLDEAYAKAHMEVTSGRYVMIAVTDTGVGMSEQTIEKAFEPFFTTKESGRGTGLGLSQVYGFIKQSNGHVKIYSELGEGTTVKLYLPRAAGADLYAHEQVAAAPNPERQRSCPVRVGRRIGHHRGCRGILH
jgi:hypothetical protein